MMGEEGKWMKIIELAHVLVNDALRIKENEIVEVTLTGERKYFDFLDEFTLAISKLGAFPTVRLHTPSYRRRFLKEIPEKYLRRTPPQALKWIKDINRHVTILAEDPDCDPPDIPNRRTKIAMEARRPILEQVKHLAVSRIHLPTPELADFYKIEPELFNERMISGFDVNYDALRRQCKKISDILRLSKKKIRILTGGQYELEFRINGRPIHVEDGAREIPAGSVFVAPIESTVSGSILLDGVIYQGKKLTNLILTFENGRVISSSADDNHSVFTRRLKAAYGDKEIFAGFGMGVNSGVEEPIGCEVLDTRALGSIFIGLGSNMIYGGENFSDLFWMLMNTEPTIFLDDLKLMDKGILAAKLSA
jgi:aminopeptidase